MRPFILAISLSLSLGPLLSFGQTDIKIDQIRNYEGFSFGSTPDTYGKDLKLDLVISYGLKYYKYVGKSPREIHEYKIADINVGFREDLLEYVDFYFNKLNKTDFQLLYDKLCSEFGRGKFLTVTNEPGVVQAAEWKGEKTWVQLYRYNEDAIDSDDRKKTVLMISDLN